MSQSLIIPVCKSPKGRDKSALWSITEFYVLIWVFLTYSSSPYVDIPGTLCRELCYEYLQLWSLLLITNKTTAKACPGIWVFLSVDLNIRDSLWKYHLSNMLFERKWQRWKGLCLYYCFDKELAPLFYYFIFHFFPFLS